MADQATNPDVASSILELQGYFRSDDALQNAVARLTQAGFDRAELSLPTGGPGMDASPPQTDTDQRQARTLGTSMAATAGAMATAGVAAAVGIAAAPIAVAALVGGAAAGAVTGLAASAAKSAEHDTQDARAAAGDLMLAVRLRDRARQSTAEQAFRDAGAVRWATVERRAA